MKGISAAVIAAVAAAFGVLVLHVASSTGAAGNGLALTPPLGWNGYNHYGRDVTAAVVEAQARALVSSGMKAAGYGYVNVDGGWDLLERDAQGDLRPDPSKFPDGIAPVARYVHSLGLRFGIYTSVGATNCVHSAAGSYGHYQQDAATFAAWGVDFVKLDWCAVPMDQFPGMSAEQVAQRLYGQFGQALQSAGRPMVYSLSTNTARLAAWTWAPNVGNMWRTSRDITDSYAGMLGSFTLNARHYRAAGRGGWNDPDTLEVGNGGMTPAEDRTQLSLWAEMAAPLVAGNDLTAMSTATRATLTNRAVIAVDQDPLGRQARPVTSARGHWVLTKPLANRARAVVLFNASDQPATISTTARQVGLPAAARYRVNHLWSHTTTQTTATISAILAAHTVAMLRVMPTQK